MTWNLRYPTEPTNPSPLEVVNSATFGPAVRRAFHDMGRVDVTPYAIPWSGIDVPLVSDLPIKPNDRAEVNFLADSTNGVVWRLVYLRSTNKWHVIGGAPLTSQDGPGGSTTSGSFVALSPAVEFTIPLAGDYWVEWGHATYQITGGISQLNCSLDGVVNGGQSDPMNIQYAGTTTAANLTTASRVTVDAAGEVLALRWAVTAGTGNHNYIFLKATPIVLST